MTASKRIPKRDDKFRGPQDDKSETLFVVDYTYTHAYVGVYVCGHFPEQAAAEKCPRQAEYMLDAFDYLYRVKGAQV